MNNKSFLYNHIFYVASGVSSFAERDRFMSSKDNEGKIVVGLEVKNNKAVSSATILSKVQTVTGKPFSQLMVNQDLKRLYAADFFTDISIEVEPSEGGVKVIFVVTEKPIVDKVLFEGNKVIRVDRLKPLVKTKPEQMLNYRDLKVDTEAISGLYEKNGFHLVKIQYKAEVDENTNRAIVIYQIQEAERVKIRNIFFEGNRAFADARLLKLM